MSRPLTIRAQGRARHANSAILPTRSPPAPAMHASRVVVQRRGPRGSPSAGGDRRRSMTVLARVVAIALPVVLLLGAAEASANTVFSDAGTDVASITDTVNVFRAALGDPNNLNAPGPLAAGRREINWDGAALPPTFDGTAPATPFVVFRNTRGATFTTPGTGLTQAASTGGLLSLDLINSTYDDLFAAFSPNRLFTPIGSNVTVGVFSVPGTN